MKNFSIEDFSKLAIHLAARSFRLIMKLMKNTKAVHGDIIFSKMSSRRVNILKVGWLRKDHRRGVGC